MSTFSQICLTKGSNFRCWRALFKGGVWNLEMAHPYTKNQGIYICTFSFIGPLFSFSAAHKVELKDASFPAEDFENVRGSLEVRWERIAPGSNVSHVVILKPLKSGYFNFTAAEVTYLAKEGDTDVQVIHLLLYSI